MGEIARIAVEHAAPIAERRSCQVEVRIQPDLPKVQGDFAQLLQLADNLVGNAIRYGCNEKSRDVAVEVRSDGQHVIFSVKDGGDGIAKQHLPRLTERFYRVDPARSRESGGTGLGLAIVKHIVERHRGELRIESEPGNGTEVTVTIPTC